MKIIPNCSVVTVLGLGCGAAKVTELACLGFLDLCHLNVPKLGRKRCRGEENKLQK